MTRQVSILMPTLLQISECPCCMTLRDEEEFSVLRGKSRDPASEKCEVVRLGLLQANKRRGASFISCITRATCCISNTLLR
jgi:hypothetical protein